MATSEKQVPLQQLLTEREAAEILRVSPRQLQMMRYRGDGPVFVRLSRRSVRYSPGDLADWVASRSFTSTSQESVLAARAQCGVGT